MLAIAVARDDEDLLVVTGNGYGKRTPMSDYPRKGRPTKGVRTIKVTDRKGELVTARPVREGQELLLISQLGPGHPHRGRTRSAAPAAPPRACA